MLDAILLLLHLDCHNMDARLLVNDVEVAVRERCDNTEVRIDASRWLVNGVNEIVLQGRPGWSTRSIPRGPNATPRLRLSPSWPTHALLTTALRPPKRTLEMRDPTGLQTGRFLLLDSDTITLERGPGPRPWERGETLQMDEETKRSAAIMMEQLGLTLQSGTATELRSAFAEVIRRDAYRLGLSEDVQAGVFISTILDARTSRTIQLRLPPEESRSYSLHGRSRILRIRGPGNNPPLVLDGPDNGALLGVDVDLARVGGRWILL